MSWWGAFPRGAPWLAAAVATVLLAGGSGCGGRGPIAPAEGEWRRRAEALETAGHPDSALAAYREAAQRYPTTSWPWAGAGRSAARLGRFAEASNDFRTVVRWDSAAVDARVELARIALADGHVGDALTWLDDATRTSAEDAPRLALRARILATAGRRGEARAAADRALALAPGDPEANAASVFCRVAEDSTSAALAEIEDALHRLPDDARLRDDHARVLEARGDVDGAIGELQRALAIDARQPRLRGRLAALLVRAGRPSDAEPHWRRLLEDDPADIAALDGLGSCALARGDPAAGEEAFRRAIAFDPESGPSYLSLGKFLAAAGRGEEAVATLRKARARAVGDAELWSRSSLVLAETYLALGETANALGIADAVLERDPGSAEAHELRGRALAAGGAGATSGEELAHVLSSPGAVPSDVRAWARWLLRRGDVPRALAALDSLIAAHPDDEEAHVLRAEALVAGGKAAAAERELSDVVARGEAPPAARALLAHLHGEAALARGDVDEARAELERERDLVPEDPRPWLALGDLEMQHGLPDSAAARYEEATRRDPTSGIPWLSLGRAQEKAGRAATAITTYRAAVDRDEKLVEAQRRLAWLLADGDVDAVQAESHARAAVDLAPDDPDALVALGWAIEKNGRHDEAEPVLERAVRLAPRDARAHYLLGAVQAARGRAVEARTELSRALTIDPSFDHAEDARRLLERVRR